MTFQGCPNVNHFDTNWKVCDFLLVNNSNVVVSRTVSDIIPLQWAKSADLGHSTPLRAMNLCTILRHWNLQTVMRLCRASKIKDAKKTMEQWQTIQLLKRPRKTKLQRSVYFFTAGNLLCVVKQPHTFTAFSRDCYSVICKHVASVWPTACRLKASMAFSP